MQSHARRGVRNLISMGIKFKSFSVRHKLSEEFKEYCKKTKTDDGYELEPCIMNFICWYDNKIRNGAFA